MDATNPRALKAPDSPAGVKREEGKTGWTRVALDTTSKGRDSTRRALHWELKVAQRVAMARATLQLAPGFNQRRWKANRRVWTEAESTRTSI